MRRTCYNIILFALTFKRPSTETAQHTEYTHYAASLPIELLIFDGLVTLEV